MFVPSLRPWPSQLPLPVQVSSLFPALWSVRKLHFTAPSRADMIAPPPSPPHATGQEDLDIRGTEITTAARLKNLPAEAPAGNACHRIRKGTKTQSFKPGPVM